jgi:predicted PurR-regulated permease PerM
MDATTSNKPAFRFLVVILALCIGLIAYIAKPFIEPIAIAIIISVAFNSLHRRILKRTGKPTRAATLTIVCLLLGFAIPIGLIVLAAGGQAMSAAHVLSQKSAEQGGFMSLIMHIVEKPIAILGRHARVSPDQVREQITSHLQQGGVKLLEIGAAILGNLLGLFANLVLALFTAFFLFRDGDRIVSRLVDVMPLTEEQGRRLMSAVSDAIVANFYALVAVGGAQGLLVAIGLMLVGIPSAILLGVVASVCSLVPVVGPALVWAPAAGYLLFSGRLIAAIFLILWGVFAVGLIDNIIRPLVVSGRVEVHPLLLLFALLGGAKAFGFVGIFIGPVLLSLVTAVVATLTEVEERATGV